MLPLAPTGHSSPHGLQIHPVAVTGIPGYRVRQNQSLPQSRLAMLLGLGGVPAVPEFPGGRYPVGVATPKSEGFPRRPPVAERPNPVTNHQFGLAVGYG